MVIPPQDDAHHPRGCVPQLVLAQITSARPRHPELVTQITLMLLPAVHVITGYVIPQYLVDNLPVQAPIYIRCCVGIITPRHGAAQAGARWVMTQVEVLGSDLLST